MQSGWPKISARINPWCSDSYAGALQPEGNGDQCEGAEKGDETGHDAGFFIQCRAGTPGNFEAVIPWPDAELAYFWRDNNNGPNRLKWFGPNLFGAGEYKHATLIESDFRADPRAASRAPRGSRMPTRRQHRSVLARPTLGIRLEPTGAARPGRRSIQHGVIRCSCGEGLLIRHPAPNPPRCGWQIS